MTVDEDTHPIVCEGRLVALAAPSRCYLLTAELTDEQFQLVTAICLCSREVRAGRLEGPFTPELAEHWARIFLAL